MKNHFRILAALLAFGLGAGSAAAQPSLDEKAQAEKLSDCVVLKTTGEDRLTVARWMIGAFASAPQLSDLVVIEPGKKVATDQAMARLFTRLMAVDCAREARPLFSAKTVAGFETVGEKLGEIGVTELFTNKAASQALEAYADYLNEADFRNVAE